MVEDQWFLKKKICFLATRQAILESIKKKVFLLIPTVNW